MATVTAGEGRQLVVDALSDAIGGDDAATVADHLVDASLRGYAEFGVVRVLELAGAVRSRTPGAITLISDSAGAAILDGADNIGYVVARRATELAVAKAITHGVAVVGAHSTYFTGLLAYYAELAARRGLASVIISSGEPLVAPHGGQKARLGTNPIAIGVPGDDPIIWDIGTAAVMRGSVWRRARAGLPLAEGLALDEEGRPTVDPAEALRGALLPWGGHRGSGLSVMVQLLGLLAGAMPAVGREVGAANGFLVVAIDPDALCGRSELAAAVTTFVDQLRSAGEPGQVRLPYERSVDARLRAGQEGFEIEDGVLAELRGLAANRPGTAAGQPTSARRAAR